MEMAFDVYFTAKIPHPNHNDRLCRKGALIEICCFQFAAMYTERKTFVLRHSCPKTVMQLMNQQNQLSRVPGFVQQSASSLGRALSHSSACADLALSTDSPDPQEAASSRPLLSSFAPAPISTA
jgi:hypothetical protein